MRIAWLEKVDEARHSIDFYDAILTGKSILVRFRSLAEKIKMVILADQVSHIVRVFIHRVSER